MSGHFYNGDIVRLSAKGRAKLPDCPHTPHKENGRVYKSTQQGIGVDWQESRWMQVVDPAHLELVHRGEAKGEAQ